MDAAGPAAEAARNQAPCSCWWTATRGGGAYGNERIVRPETCRRPMVAGTSVSVQRIAGWYKLGLEDGYGAKVRKCIELVR